MHHMTSYTLYNTHNSNQMHFTLNESFIYLLYLMHLMLISHAYILHTSVLYAFTTFYNLQSMQHINRMYNLQYNAYNIAFAKVKCSIHFSVVKIQFFFYNRVHFFIYLINSSMKRTLMCYIKISKFLN